MQSLLEEFPEQVNFSAAASFGRATAPASIPGTVIAVRRTDPSWSPYKKFNGDWQHLYPKLVTDLAEKHLDFERFCRAVPKIQVRAREWETAFWLGTMAGERTWSDCIDVDSHDVVGWYGLPSRWNSDTAIMAWRGTCRG